ncbi:MAG TPA: zf-HC2 domain-containing protein [Actinomycetes bacterium]
MKPRGGGHPGDRLAALVDGLVPEPDRSRLLAHLAGCPQCRADYDAQRAVKGLLADLPGPPAPASLAARLAALADPTGPGLAHPLPEPQDEPVRAPHHRVLVASAGLFSVLLLGLVTAYAVGGSPEGPAVTPPVSRFVREHAAVTSGVPLFEPVLSAVPTSFAPASSASQP